MECLDLVLLKGSHQIPIWTRGWYFCGSLKQSKSLQNFFLRAVFSKLITIHILKGGTWWALSHQWGITNFSSYWFPACALSSMKYKKMFGLKSGQWYRKLLKISKVSSFPSKCKREEKEYRKDERNIFKGLLVIWRKMEPGCNQV